jgi:hypothetical protein
MMRRFTAIAGLCLASVLAMGMALAGNASAAVPLWLLCLKGTTGVLPTKYTTNQCTMAASGNNGEWESVAIGNKSDTVRILALSLRWEDTKGELGAAVKVKCNHLTWIGLISGRNLLLARQVNAEHPSTECEAEGTGFFKVCKASTLEEVEGVHLPWRIEFYEEKGGKYLGRIQPDAGGEPGWIVKCAGQTDECSLSEGAGTLEEITSENKVTEGVLLVFGKFTEAHSGKCTIGGSKAARLAGFLAFLLSNGNGLSLNL